MGHLMKANFNPRSLLFVLIIVVGGWLLFHRDEIHNVSDAFQVASRQFGSLTAQSSNLLTSAPLVGPAASATDSQRPPGLLRVASFNLHNYGLAKSKRFHVMEFYGRIIRQFDIVAVQGIRTDDTNVIAALMDHVNRNGGQYGILTSPRVGRLTAPQQYAFIYDTRRVQPAGKPYVVSDPDALLNRPPFVGWFRCLGPSPERAFTFSLVNWHVEESTAEAELQHLLNLSKAVRQDGRQEDDVIVLGTLQAGDEQLAPLVAGSTFNWLVRSPSTLVDGAYQSDNLVIDGKSTVEFTGRSGVFDFLREFNLNIPQSLEVSEHLPIWAEFFVEEGRASGLVASDSSPGLR